MSTNREYSFWGSLSPLGGLTGAALLIIASGRLSWAIVTAGSLLWVYGLATLAFSFFSSSIIKKNILPEKGRDVIFTLLAVFFGSVYLLLFWLLCPLAAFEVFLLLLLVPLFCACSGILRQMTSVETRHFGSLDHVSSALSQGALLSGLIIAFSIIREPLSYCALSIPGSAAGMVTIVFFKSGSFFPIGIFASSSGALLLLGFFVCLYQYGKNTFSGRA